MKKNIPAGKRIVAAALSAAIWLSALAPQAASAAARQVSAARAAAHLPAGPIVLPASAVMPSGSVGILPSLGAVPLLAASALPVIVVPLPAAPVAAAAAAMVKLEEQVALPLADPKADVAAHLGRVFDSAEAPRVSELERALRQAQISLKRSASYKILILNPDSKELEDPGLYAGLSGGFAQVTTLRAAEPLAALAEAVDQGYQAVVLGNASLLLPPARSKDALRLEMALKRLDSAKLKGLGAADLVDRLYAGLGERGMVFMSFAPEDRGVATWEKILRCWEASDGGKFHVTRVDLEAGGHIVILRKVEARVGLWLRPLKGGRIETSVIRASDSAEGLAAARRSLEVAGFTEHLALFDKLGVRVRHVFGADVGRQELYITIPRSNVTAIHKYVSSTAKIVSSQTQFSLQLMDSSALQGVPPVWKLGVTGSGGKIAWVDTGADASHEDFGGRLDVIDMVNEGPEDWYGHGTHVAGISLSGNAGFFGMAKAALGTMFKVFSRDQDASDGDIMGSAVIALKKGCDVISLSFGVRSAENLAEFLSQLTHQKNSAGDYPIISASAGNSGPFDQSVSDPAGGADVLAVAAAAKSLDDGRPEIASYSSVGPVIGRRFAIKRFRLKPDITGIGGIDKYGVYSAKSKDAPRSASDLEDDRHTGKSGTSMSNPAVAGVALLVKLAMKAAGVITPFVAENLPFAVKAVLMRSSKDLGVPVWFQGAGLVDAGAAVKLVTAAAGRELGSRLKSLFSPLPAPAEGWGWLERLKAVTDAEDRVFREAETVKRFN
ncbi:MAG: S8 family serine peptidase, partial [Elusimicrobiota bacterium]